MRLFLNKPGLEQSLLPCLTALGLLAYSTLAAPSYPNTTTLGKATTAVEAMMSFYNHTTGLWGTSSDPWWMSGNTLQALLDYMEKSGSRKYIPVAENTIDIQRAPLPWWPSGGGDFRADSTDDTGWWALANVRMYDLTGNQSYLNIAKEDEAYINTFRDNGTCRPGILWDIPARGYVNAISNELYLLLTASLHNRIPGDMLYLSRATQEWNFFKKSGMINSDNLINDGLAENNLSCVNNGQMTWTYNQGVILGGLTELYNATGDPTLLPQAQAIADAVTTSPSLSPNGILTESCEPSDCDSNQTGFKCIFVRYLGALNDHLAGAPYEGYLTTQESSVYSSDRSRDLYGLRWAGPYSPGGISTQVSVVSLLVSLL